MGIYKAGKCDACGGLLTLIQNLDDRKIVGHTKDCMVKNSNSGYVPDLPKTDLLAKELKNNVT